MGGDGSTGDAGTDAQTDGSPMVGTPGFKVEPTTGLQTNEDGKEATFTVALTGTPTADVKIALSSDDESEGKITSLAELTFTTANWQSPQTVTIKGQNDDEADGEIAYKIILAPATSADSRYAGKDPDDVSVVNADNDTAGFTFTDEVGLKTTEAGGEDTFSIRLNTAPAGEQTVSIGFVSSNTAEVTVTPPSVVFTRANWNAPRTITVKGVNDNKADGNVTVNIVTTATSTDARYAIDIKDLSVVNEDNDTAGFTVVPTTGLRTNENGRQDSFKVSLVTQPTADVTIPVASANPDEVTVSKSSLTFTNANWNAPQTVLVTGVNDNDEDGNAPFTITLAAATSTDAAYTGKKPSDVTGINVDNDSAGITLDGDQGLTVSENGGQATFTVVLNRAPTATVTIALSSSDASEATVAPASLVFTTSNWNSPQTVTVTGVDDTDADGPQDVTIDLADPVSDDEAYEDLTGPNVTVTVTDDETAGITVKEIEPFETSESGGEATFTIVLDAKPASSVTIPIASTDTDEVTVNTPSVTFTTTDWAAPQTVRLTGKDDDIIDGSQPVTITIGAATSSDAAYQGRDANDLVVLNIDNDSAGATIVPRTGLETSETGSQASFTIRLNTKPTNNVSFSLAVPDTTEGTISASLVTFTDVNWNAPQTVTLTGVDDNVADGPQEYTVVFGPGVSDDARYAGLVVPNLTVINNDNDTAGLELLDTANLTTTEAPGGSATFRIRLRSQPTENVTINLVSSNTNEGTVLPVSLTFDALNWNAAQSVTVTGVDDLIQDGPQSYRINYAVQSADGRYDALPDGSVDVSNTDNDTAGVTVVGVSDPLTVSEAGTQTTFTIKLNTQPVAPVTIPVSVSAPLEASLSTTSVSFDATNWNGLQTVTVTGLGDLLQDGNQEFTINFGPIQGGPTYSAITVPPLTVTNFDTDSPGINVVRTGPLLTREDGSQTSFRVSLGRQPAADVRVPIVVLEPNEARVISAATLLFTSANYATEVTVVIAGWDDNIADGPQPFRVQVGPAESTDVSYAGRTVPYLNGTNSDDDSPGVVVNPITPLSVTEGGATDSFTVSLASEPVGIVTIPVIVLDPTQVTANQVLLTFDSSNWNSAQPVTVTAVNDLISDNPQGFSIALGPVQASASDANYQGITIPNVTGVAIDNDVAGLEVNPNVFSLPPPPELITTEAGGTNTFQVRLTSQPVAPVTINVASTSITEGTVSPASITVQPADFATWQTFTVTGVDDSVEDGNAAYFITIASASDDPKYDLTVPNLPMRNTDNDTRGISISTGALSPTSESGLPARTFTIALNSEPTAPVRIDLASNDTGEIAIDIPSVTFTAANWNVPRTITVTGVDDFIDDGPQARRVDILPADSGDLGYNGMVVTNQVNTYVTVTNNDDDTASIAIPDDDIEVYDQLSTDTFTMVLTSQPLVPVTIPLINDDPSEITLSAASVIFTTTNWNVPQTITVTSVNDNLRDGDQTFLIRTDLAQAVGDPNYNGMDGPDVTVTAIDGGTSCLSIKVQGPASASGMYVLDPDLKGPIARFPAWCDMTTQRGTQVGGWTLVSWSVNTDAEGGVPYPGLAQCGQADFRNCDRGTGVPSAAINALLDTSTELAQGQTITENAVAALTDGFIPLSTYEFAGSFVYTSLADLSVATGATTCSALATGTYAVITGTPAYDGATVYLAQSFAGGPDTARLDFSSDANTYRWSLGNRTGSCLTNGTPPASYLGNWQDTQYGPEQQNAAGAYSVWVR